MGLVIGVILGIVALLYALSLVVPYEPVKVNRKVLRQVKDKYEQKARQYATGVVSDSFLLAVIYYESRGKESARGRDGEWGIFQIMPFHFPEKMGDREKVKVSVQFKYALGILEKASEILARRGELTPVNLYAFYNGGWNYKTRICQQRGQEVSEIASMIPQI